MIPRLINDLSFVLTSAILGPRGVGKQDIVIYHSPPLFTSLSARAVALQTRAKTIMWAADIWPDVLIQTAQAKPGLGIKVMEVLERFAYRHADLLAVTNPGAKQRIQQRFPDQAITVWSNGADRNVFRPELRSEAVRREFGAGPEDFLVGYLGLHGRFQGLDAVVDAADHLREHSRIKIAMIGGGAEKPRLVERANELKLPNLVFYDPRPKSEMPPLLASCDASLAPLLTRMPGTMPSKAYEALAAGTPILVARECEAEQLVDKYNVGGAFEPQDGKDLAEAILSLARNPQETNQMRANAVELSKRFSRDVLAGRILETLDAVHNDRPIPTVQW
jgi:hypothetical protein